MEQDNSSCPSSSTDGQSCEILELNLEQGINVWGTNQQILEEQAQHELDIFTQENSSKTNLEEGEVVDNNKSETFASTLDVNSYIKRQEELKKLQAYQRTLHVSSKSKIVADKISKQQRKNKRKRSDSSVTSKTKIVKLEAPSNCDSNSLVTEPVVKENDGSGSEYVPSEDEEDSDFCVEAGTSSRKKKSICHPTNIERDKDDGSLELYKSRLEEYYKELENAGIDDNEPEDLEYYTIKGGLKIPFKIWNDLYSYQQDGVRWLWKIHQQNTGGILGDEMGLGKTVQVIAFLAGIEYSKVISNHVRHKGLGPTLIVCPATVIHQWVKHFHDWYPEFRVAILHQSGSYQGNKNELIKEINSSGGILVTTYSGVLKYKGSLAEHNWYYLILDEGHKIRNQNAKVSVAVKQFTTFHRLMLTGSPMQNNLQELWSLFDFTNPGMLGNLTTFMEHFNYPIIQGGFANATPMQEATALSVATTLKNLITPFLLRRSKSEVQEDICLPNKSEQVLFCSLTDEQWDLYKGYLMSEHVENILGKGSKNWFSENHMRANVLVAITTLRKICNHPDLYLNEAENEETHGQDVPDEERFGHYKKSGKMIVVSALLKIWKKQKHRVLLFTQSRGMIAMFEKFLAQEGYKYLKMDGGTTVSSRQPLINKFNEDESYDVFLLTTKVGGLGINLTGANRVIIYDPDWNPATDTQARERAWRIGQDKQVTIYRLLSAGTIEEKMYQRQVWKQLLSNKVLLDPNTQKFFKSSGLHDLFSLPATREGVNPETTNIFRDSRVKIQEKLEEKRNRTKIQFSEEKIQAMKNLAQQIAKSLSGDKPEVKKSSYQIELEEERKKKLAEKQELKKLSAMELLSLNREKAKGKPEIDKNQVDDCDTKVSFTRALEYSEKTAKLYTQLREGKLKPSKSSDDEREKDNLEKKKKKKHKDIFKSIVDETGVIDGEKVDGLVKTEVKKLRKKYEKTNKSESQDQYVLEKLFTKKGVSGALQHDSIVENNVKIQSLKVQTEAKLRADKALEALRKSRLTNWRW